MVLRPLSLPPSIHQASALDNAKPWKEKIDSKDSLIVNLAKRTFACLKKIHDNADLIILNIIGIAVITSGNPLHVLTALPVAGFFALTRLEGRFQKSKLKYQLLPPTL